MPITFNVANKPLAAVRRVDDGKTPLKTESIARSQRSAFPRGKTWNGFVNTVTEAYNQHHHLILRPDDVWLAIAIQFSAYVEKNAEHLRAKFVEHTGKKELVVRSGGTLHTADYAGLTQRMAVEISKNIKDPSIANWVLPKFSTTTPTDTVAGAITLMAGLKQYFSYKFDLRCGLPKVTLEGTVEDWEEIERRAQRLVEFDGAEDKQMAKWLTMLAPVLAHFTRSAKGNPDVEWWNRVCSHLGGGSGPSYLSGWITVFCVFNDKGGWIGDTKSAHHWADGTLQCIDKYAPEGWPIINTNDIPSGSCEVDVIIDDNGTTHNCELVAGHRAMLAPEPTSLMPSVEWFLRLKKEKPEKDKSDLFDMQSNKFDD